MWSEIAIYTIWVKRNENGRTNLVMDLRLCSESRELSQLRVSWNCLRFWVIGDGVDGGDCTSCRLVIGGSLEVTTYGERIFARRPVLTTLRVLQEQKERCSWLQEDGEKVTACLINIMRHEGGRKEDRQVHWPDSDDGWIFPPLRPSNYCNSSTIHRHVNSTLYCMTTTFGFDCAFWGSCDLFVRKRDHTFQRWGMAHSDTGLMILFFPMIF